MHCPNRPHNVVDSINFTMFRMENSCSFMSLILSIFIFMLKKRQKIFQSTREASLYKVEQYQETTAAQIKNVFFLRRKDLVFLLLFFKVLSLAAKNEKKKILDKSNFQ